MVQLLCNTNCLRLYNDHDTPSPERFCKLCNNNLVESTFHFVMECSAFTYNRRKMYNRLQAIICNETMNIFFSRSPMMQFYILLGLDYPFHNVDIEMLRCCSAYHIHEMYYMRVRCLTNDD